jgi:hypothetical protein
MFLVYHVVSGSLRSFTLKVNVVTRASLMTRLTIIPLRLDEGSFDLYGLECHVYLNSIGREEMSLIVAKKFSIRYDLMFFL